MSTETQREQRGSPPGNSRSSNREPAAASSAPIDPAATAAFIASKQLQDEFNIFQKVR